MLYGRFKRGPQRLSKGMFLASVAILFTILVSACSSNPQVQQKAETSKAGLDSLLTNARSIGIPNNMLQPIIRQEAQLSSTNAPISLFNDQSVNDYYSNLGQRYQNLAVQVRGLTEQTTQQSSYQASLDLRNFQSALAERQSQGFIEAKAFANQLAQDQKLLAQAQYPKDYLRISNDAKRAAQALRLMGPTYDNLKLLQQAIARLNSLHLDTTALNQQVRDDLQSFRVVSTPEDFAKLIDQTTVQLQETVALSTLAIPYIGKVKLEQFRSDIDLIKQYGTDTTAFQQRLSLDQAALAKASGVNDYLKLSAQIDRDIASIQLPLVQAQANFLMKQFDQQVANWGNTNQYQDPYDGKSYKLDYEYDQQGIGSDLDQLLQAAQTQDDYQAAISTIKDDFTNLKAMEADYKDKTPWNQPHATDLQLMRYYNLTSGQAIFTSMIDQSSRLYKDGKLVKAFLITSGMYARPALPGRWNIFVRLSPTVFKSGDSKNSPFWYPDTPIQYAMQYHEGGFFFHDSWWRANYGPGTNFPHQDASGNWRANDGSHGCISMSTADAAWLYANTGWGLPAVIY